MRRYALTIGCAICLLLECAPCPAQSADARPRVSLEVLTQQGLAPTATQQWYRTLTDLGISGLQIRTATPRDQATITRQGTDAAPSYRVVGILSGDNVLSLPGGRFRASDTAGLRKWLDNVRDQGAEGVTQPRAAFGLVPRQLQEVTADLKMPVTFSTAGLPATTAVEQIARQLRFPLELDAAARRALAETKITDELRGLSSGTALAISLRPAGLVLLPERPTGGRVQYRVVPGQRGSSAWPLGWTPQKRVNDVLPRLFEFLNVEITGIPVSEAVDAIADRLELKTFYDHNALALHGVDPAKIPAEVPTKRISYSQTLRRVLAQAKLKYELRVDEAEKPFLWITTVKPAG
ncbi:MAG: hypothetical protein AB7O59_16620 [Pirellulales bacterium]